MALERFEWGKDFCQSIGVSSGPNNPGPINVQCPYIVIAEAGRIGSIFAEVGGFSRGWLKATQAAIPGAKPEIPRLVLPGSENAGSASAFFWVEWETGDLPSATIIFVKPAVVGSNPNCPTTVFHQSCDVIVGKRSWIPRITVKNYEPVSLIPIQSILRAHPKVSAAVLQDAGGGVLSESPVHRKK